MDWFSWLSKTEIQPSLVQEYSLAFARNELGEEDIAYFNHEFLQSIGISIAKHRLEIIKLAKKEKGGSPHPVSRLIIAAIKKTKRCLSSYIHTWVHGDDSALMVVQKPSSGKRWREAMLKRNKRQRMLKQGKLMLSNGNPGPNGGGGSPVAHQVHKHQKFDGDSSAAEEIRWDALFQDLKPT